MLSPSCRSSSSYAMKKALHFKASVRRRAMPCSSGSKGLKIRDGWWLEVGNTKGSPLVPPYVHQPQLFLFCCRGLLSRLPVLVVGTSAGGRGVHSRGWETRKVRSVMRGVNFSGPPKLEPPITANILASEFTAETVGGLTMDSPGAKSTAEEPWG